jgi:phosphatidylinositol-3-phosphatase
LFTEPAHARTTACTMLAMRRAPVVLALALACLWASPALAAGPLPPVKHAWVIVLENKDFEESFGPDSKAPYLARELTARGQLLTEYYGTSHASLGNYISMMSGQAPNPDTQADCQVFRDVFPGTPMPDGQTMGVGCVYPPEVRTFADQLDAKGVSWKGYMQDMGSACRHPAIGARDDTQEAEVGDQYATRHNPFVYFHSVIDDPGRCAARVVDLNAMQGDLAKRSTTPGFSFIVPDLCEDGHDDPCVDGRPGGLESADAFLKAHVPRIIDSPAFKAGGLLIVTWDEANIDEDGSTACCDQPTGPNTPAPGVLGPGGGRTGTVVISPWTAAGGKNATPYNHYSLLRSLEDLFGVEHLGYAAQDGLKPFGSDVFNRAQAAVAPGCTERVRIRRKGGRALLLVRSSGARTVRVRRHGRRARTYALTPCRTRGIVLGPRHGRIRVSLGGKARTYRY